MEDFLDDSRAHGEEASTSTSMNVPPSGSSISFAPSRAKLKPQTSHKQVKLKANLSRKSNSGSFRPLIAADENEFDIAELVQPLFLIQTLSQLL
jgi:hypothetical protein